MFDWEPPHRGTDGRLWAAAAHPWPHGQQRWRPASTKAGTHDRNLPAVHRNCTTPSPMTAQAFADESPRDVHLGYQPEGAIPSRWSVFTGKILIS